MQDDCPAPETHYSHTEDAKWIKIAMNGENADSSADAMTHRDTFNDAQSKTLSVAVQAQASHL